MVVLNNFSKIPIIPRCFLYLISLFTNDSKSVIISSGLGPQTYIGKDSYDVFFIRLYFLTQIFFGIV